MRSLMLSTAVALALAAGAQAQDPVTVLVIEGTDTAPADLAGRPVYATAGEGSDATAVTDVPPSWVEVGVMEGLAASGEAAVIRFAEGTMGADATEAEVALGRLRLVPDEDDPGEYFVFFDADETPLSDQLVELEQERLARLAAADGDPLEQDEAMSESPIAEGTDGLTDEGEPIDGGASVGDVDGGPEVIVIEPDEDGAMATEPEPEAEVVAVEPEAQEPLREVDITDPDAPPIENAENVIPERDAGDQAQVPLIKAETGLTSPSHTAPMTAGASGQAIAQTNGIASATGMMRPASAPENFAVADMATMDVTQLLGTRVYGVNDERLGEIDRWIGEAPGQLPEAAVVDVGGFLGLGERQVAIGTDLLTLMTDVDGNDLRVYVALTEEQIEELPEIEG